MNGCICGAHGATFIPIILDGDKTTITVGTCQQEYWPVYLSIINVHNNIRCACGSVVKLLAFLAIPKSEFFLFFNIFLGLSLWFPLSRKEPCK